MYKRTVLRGTVSTVLQKCTAKGRNTNRGAKYRFILESFSSTGKRNLAFLVIDHDCVGPFRVRIGHITEVVFEIVRDKEHLPGNEGQHILTPTVIVIVFIHLRRILERLIVRVEYSYVIRITVIGIGMRVEARAADAVAPMTAECWIRHSANHGYAVGEMTHHGGGRELHIQGARVAVTVQRALVKLNIGLYLQRPFFERGRLFEPIVEFWKRRIVAEDSAVEGRVHRLSENILIHQQVSGEIAFLHSRVV